LARLKIINTEASRILAELAMRFFDNRCFVTHKKFQSRGFTLHHLWYIKNDVRRENYPKGVRGRDEYYRDLKPLVEKAPHRFLLITNGVHTRIDHHRRGLSRMNRDNFLRLFMAVILTRKNGSKE
jgi:hypothetical protein